MTQRLYNQQTSDNSYFQTQRQESRKINMKGQEWWTQISTNEDDSTQISFNMNKDQKEDGKHKKDRSYKKVEDDKD